MQDFDVGQQLGELKGQIAGLYTRMDKNDLEHAAIMKKLDGFNSWRLRTIGFISGIYVVLLIAWELIRDKFSS